MDGSPRIDENRRRRRIGDAEGSGKVREAEELGVGLGVGENIEGVQHGLRTALDLLGLLDKIGCELARAR